MFLDLFFFLQDISTTKAVDQILQLSPLNAYGYGFACLTLSILAYVFYIRWQKVDEYAKELSKQLIDNYKDVLQVLTKVELRLGDQQVMMKNMDETKNLVSQSLDHIKAILSKLESDGKRNN